MTIYIAYVAPVYTDDLHMFCISKAKNKLIGILKSHGFKGPDKDGTFIREAEGEYAEVRQFKTDTILH